MCAESREYIHYELNREVTAIGGHYVLTQEVRLPFKGREILYVVGYGVVDNSCCGVGGMAFALVPGFVLDWKSTTNNEGLATSLVEPVGDQVTQRENRQLIERREIIHQVQFQ